MRVYVDTNILIDFVCQRAPFAESANRLVALGYMGKVKLLTLSLSYVTAMYVAHKYEYNNVRESLLAIYNIIEIVDLEAKTVINMLSSDWADYEDSIQHQSALNAYADCIVTRNKKDFKASSLSVYSVEELFASLDC